MTPETGQQPRRRVRDHAAAHGTRDDAGNSLPLQNIDSGQIGWDGPPQTPSWDRSN